MAHWVDEFADAEGLTEAQTDARATAAVAAGIRIQAEGPEFLRLLELELRDTARRLSEKPNLHLSASVTNSSEPEVETRLHVQVSSNAGWPEVTYTDIFHGIGQSVIRCHTTEGTAFRLRFVAHSYRGAVGVCAENGDGTVMTPAQAAQYIVKPMVKRVRGQ
jgi:hypothetical protein